MPKPKGESSSSFRIFETDEFTKQLGKLHPEDTERILEKLREYVYPQMKKQPFLGPNIKKLQACHPPLWRYRIGTFRLFYNVDVEQHIVNILTVEFRKDAYR
jgi:mRNA interferase RelE/StbE